MTETRDRGLLLWQFHVALETFHETGRREDFPFDLLNALKDEALPLRESLLQEASHCPELFRPEVEVRELPRRHHQAIKGYTLWNGHFVSYGDYGWCALVEDGRVHPIQGMEEHLVSGVGTKHGLYLRTEEGHLYLVREGETHGRFVDGRIDGVLPWKDAIAWRKGSCWESSEGVLLEDCPDSLRLWTEEALTFLMDEPSEMPEEAGDVFLDEDKGFFLGKSLWRREGGTWISIGDSPGRLLDVTAYDGRWVGLFQKGEVVLLDGYGSWPLGTLPKMRGIVATEEGILCGGWDGEEIFISVVPGGDWDLFSRRVREKVLYG